MHSFSRNVGILLLVLLFVISLGIAMPGCGGRKIPRPNRGGGGGGDSSQSDGRNNGGGSDSDSDPGDDAYGDGSVSIPDHWIFGILGSPHLGKEIGAEGVRAIVDMNDLTNENMNRMIDTFSQLNMGICLTLRWKDPTNLREEILPSSRIVNEKVDVLMAGLASAEARQLGDRVWVQFFNEVTGGPGTIRPQHVDSLYAWATDTALRIRREAPHVNICGPALTGLDVLEGNERSLSPLGRDRRVGLLRAIRWSVQYADAADVHLHAESGPWARAELRAVREAIDREGGKNTDICVWEWSCAKWEGNRNDHRALRNVLIEVWRAMCAANVRVSAYGAYYPPTDLGPIFQWKNLRDDKGAKNEPFWSTYIDIGQGKIEPTG